MVGIDRRGKMTTNQNIILDKIPFLVDKNKLFQKLRIEKDGEHASELQKIIDLVTPLIKPKAIYKVCDVDAIDDDRIKIGDAEFTSRVLRKNLKDVNNVFVFIATCGNELENLNIPKYDFLIEFWVQTIKEFALEISVTFLHEFIKKEFKLERLPSMSPGSGGGNVWHIEQQKQLFSLFGNTEKLIGVRLTDSCLMIPNKSVSGVSFTKGTDFISCQLCDRENCPTRKAPFNLALETEFAD